MRGSLADLRLLRRSLVICLLVGTLLTAINQGSLILSGQFPASLAWKIPLTYAVPFCVATAGAILNRPRQPGGGPTRRTRAYM